MTDTKLPTYIPIVARDGGLYSAGAFEWSGTDVVVEPNSGVVAAGLIPGTGSWFTAQTANFLFQTYGRALDSIVDLPTFQVYSREAYVSNGIAWDSPAFTDGATNTHTGGDPVGIMTGDDGWIYIQERLLATRSRRGKGLSNSDSDTAEWTQGASCGLTSGSGETVAGIARPPIMTADKFSGLVAAFQVGGTMKGSTDRGASWSGSHTIDAGIATAQGGSPADTTAAFCWNGRVFVAYSYGAGPYFSHVWGADVSDLTTWEATFTAPSNGGSSNQFTRVCANATTMVWLNRIGNQVNVVTGSTGAWTLTTVQFAAHDTGKHNWRGAWNEQLGLFMIGSAEGDIWTSADGLTWSHIFDAGDNLFAVRDIVAHGRGFVVSNSKTEWALDFVDVASDGTWRRRKILSAFSGNSGPAGAFHIENVLGQWVAGRFINNTIWTLEWYNGGVSPFDANSYVGR